MLWFFHQLWKVEALVQQEALSCGIPIIVTPNAGGEDLIVDGITGHLVPIRSPEKIAEKVLSLLKVKQYKFADSKKMYQESERLQLV